MKILIAAHYNLNNGDRALLEATIRMINQLAPDAEIVVSAYSPDQLHDKRFGVVGWALGNGAKERIKLKLSKYSSFRYCFRRHYKLFCNRDYINAVKDADVVLVSGGHHLTDILSYRGYYKLSSNFYIPIAMGKKVVLLPQSIGPANNTDIKESIKYILNNAYSIAYRDKSSQTFIDTLTKGNSIKSKYVPDLVYSIRPNVTYKREKDCIGIALYHSYAEPNRHTILPFTMKHLVTTIDRLMRKGYSIKIIPMDTGDEEYADDIFNQLTFKDKDKRFIIANRGSSIMDIINEFSSVSMTIAYKTHSTIFSMINETPLIAVAYHPKSIEFLEQVGIAEYAIRDEDATADNLIALVDKLTINYNDVIKKEIDGVKNNRLKIDTYLKEIIK